MKAFSIKFLAFFALILASCNTEAQQSKQPVAVKKAGIEVIQFHSEYRCVTCHKIEVLTKATLTSSFTAVAFRLINVNDKKNAQMAEQFQAAGTALFLYNPVTGTKKDLTEFAFMKAGNEKVFQAELKKYIEDFIKG